VATKQELIMQTGGMQNPLCGIPEYRNTLARMLETANIADVSSYFKALPPGWMPPPPAPPAPDPNLLLAQVQQDKTAADTETDRAKAQTDRAKMVADDDRARKQSALDNWTRAYQTSATTGAPLPSIDEFTQAMRSMVPSIAMVGDVPPPTSPMPPATAQPAAPPRPPGAPQGPMGPMPGIRPPAAPMLPPAGATDPATAMAVRNALQGRGMPTPQSTLAARGNVAQGVVGPALARTNLQSGMPPNPSLT